MKSTYLLLKTLCLAACLVLSGVTSTLAKEALPMAQDPVLEKRLVLISEELRCLVCQNESLASSRAELANDLREEVRKLITQNLSDQQIKDYLVTRYGDFVLYRPQVKPLTWVLWFGPFLLLVVAVGGMFSYVRQRQAAQTTVAALSDADRHKAQAILNSGDAP
jgi:cytochrome c-type biogenesis protein CcmH